MEYNDLKDYGAAEQAMASYVEQCRAQRTAVRLHQPRRVARWQSIAAVMAVVALVAGVAWLSRPTVYGYVNGRALYSLEEAQLYAQQMLDNMAVEELQPQEDILHHIFSLD